MRQLDDINAHLESLIDKYGGTQTALLTKLKLEGKDYLLSRFRRDGSMDEVFVAAAVNYLTEDEALPFATYYINAILKPPYALDVVRYDKQRRKTAHDLDTLPKKEENMFLRGLSAIIHIINRPDKK
ncbi:hypothetical protein [Rubellicoccus peritrichatus]|uniref:Uncharacterized protein n=1 Tax=Rubellicoccus peritrichatus TaxID=3080537 RepID=A0AAQ3QSK0_9BACT|nr:hypothetical protein [Puniceicoccus sp. CR14]WOO40411.1 hypothetical protein RZN69_17465 [Puniceicoccus sp. CR14]WOO40460.1 hypothetical protein RZN69_17710 [Puniceicoccus sp. CR14]WOO40509.1 hypothetical protein RZN69_17955 [Puniceicoccus sp. CR14]WOO40559.1 hypothetical protein RZN69_18205 [Puniceicoccus sp. CR14]